MKDSANMTAAIGVTNTSQDDSEGIPLAVLTAPAATILLSEDQGDWNVYQSQFMNYSSSFNGYAWGGSTGTPAPDTSPRPRVCAAANISQILT